MGIGELAGDEDDESDEEHAKAALAADAAARLGALRSPPEAAIKFMKYS